MPSCNVANEMKHTVHELEKHGNNKSCKMINRVIPYKKGSSGTGGNQVGFTSDR